MEALSVVEHLDVVGDQETESCEISAGLEQDFGGDLGDDFVPSGAGGSSGADAHGPFAGWDCKYQLFETDAERTSRSRSVPAAPRCRGSVGRAVMVIA